MVRFEKIKLDQEIEVKKIRTYNYPQNRVTDHRIGFTTKHTRSRVGELDEIIEALITADQKLKVSGE